MNTEYIVSDSDRALLEYNGFDSFESLWDVELDWFEEPNHRRNGWSGVSRHVLKKPEGGSVAVFIKRQQNHDFKSLLHPLRGLPTIYREYRNIRRLRKYGILCAEPVFYGHRDIGGQWQAILITRSLTGYRPLEECLNSIGQDDVRARAALLASVARTLSQMHGRHLRHGSLYAKHILVRVRFPDNSGNRAVCEFDAAVIDLEKMRVHFPLLRLALRDLDQLHRRWARRAGDWESFIDSYLARIEWGFMGRRIQEAVVRKSAADWATPDRPELADSASPRLVRPAFRAILGGALGDDPRYAADAGPRSKPAQIGSEQS